METSFWFGYKFDHLLFPFVSISTYGEFSVACICLFILTLIYELLKMVQMKAKLKALIALHKLSEGADTNRLLGASPMRNSLRLLSLETGIYFLELIFGYMIMLIVMTYNAYFLIIAVGSSSLVYFIMGQLLMNFRYEVTQIGKSEMADNLSLTAEESIQEIPSHSQPEVAHI